MTVYGASKAFVLSFSEVLWAQYRNSGVRVRALCPGPTETAFFAVVGTEGAAVGGKQTAEAVVAAGLAVLDTDHPSVVSGVRNALLAWSVRLLPRAQVAKLSARLLRPERP